MRLVVDGIDVTSSSVVSATGISYQPASALPDGEHTVALTVKDGAGNTATANVTFTVDATAPTVTALTPADGSLTNGRPTISASVSDAGASASGLDTTTLRLRVGGVDVTTSAEVSGNAVSYTPPQPLPSGSVALQLDVQDLAGNATSATWSIQVDADAPTVVLTAPATGAGADSTFATRDSMACTRCSCASAWYLLKTASGTMLVVCEKMIG